MSAMLQTQQISVPSYINLTPCYSISSESADSFVVLCLVLDIFLTPKHQETHGCVVSTVATDALVLKHQAISIHNAD